MRALPARRIMTSALCAALLVGITGPAALAADSTRERSHVAPDARSRGADALVAQLRTCNGGELAPVADLLNALLEAEDGRLTAAEAGALVTAAKSALDKAADDAPATGVLLAPAAQDVEPRVPELSAADLTDHALSGLDTALDGLDAELNDVGAAVDSVLESIFGGVDDTPSSVDALLAEVADLIDELTGSGVLETTPPAVSTLPSTSPTPLTPVPPSGS
jgi:hypothetical protein